MADGSQTGTTARSRKPHELPELPLLGNQRKWNIAKIVLRSICLTFDSIAIALVVSLFVRTSYYGMNALLYTAPICGLSIIWNSAELIVICIRRNKSRGIELAAHVACDLLLWIGGVVCTGFMSYSAIFWARSNRYRKYEAVNAAHQQWLPVVEAICAMVALVAILHFVTFVRACVEVDRRSKDRRMQELVIAMTQRGENPREYLLASLEQVAHSSWGLSDNDSRRDFGIKYNHIAARVPEMGSNQTAAGVAGESGPRDANIPHTEELLVCPDDPGMNQKVLIDDVIREARARARQVNRT